MVHREGSTTEVGPEEENGQVLRGNGQESDTMDAGGGSMQSPSSVQNVDEETTNEDTENVVSSESEAPISERAASVGGFSDSPTIGSPRVQFEKIKEEEVSALKKDELPPSVAASASGHDEDRKCRRHQKHEHK